MFDIKSLIIKVWNNRNDETTSNYVIDKPQRTSHWHNSFKIQMDEGRMQTDEHFVFSTYHIDNSPNIDMKTPKATTIRKQNKKEKKNNNKRKKRVKHPSL